MLSAGAAMACWKTAYRSSGALSVVTRSSRHVGCVNAFMHSLVLVKEAAEQVTSMNAVALILADEFHRGGRAR